jgi:hypothetical protein
MAATLLLCACTSNDATGTGVDAATDASAGRDAAPDFASPTDAAVDIAKPSGDASAADAAVDAAPGDAALDAAPDGGVCTTTTLAISKVFFGDGNNGQWKSFGFNIDGLVSTATSTDVCQPNSGAPPSTPYPDGNNGIDNSFGKNLLPTILALSPTWPSDVNANIQAGASDTLFEMNCLPPMGDAPVLVTKFFDATSLGSTPKFDGTDVWPVAPELLSNPMDPDSSTIVYASSSVTGTTFDTGRNQMAAIRFPIGLNGVMTTLNLTLHAAQVQMTLSADRKSATAGMIGGVINTEELVNEIKKIGFLLNLCNNQLLTALITQVRQASDIMSDGTQDPTKTCDGISVGLGFNASQAQRGDVGPQAPMAMTCP